MNFRKPEMGGGLFEHPHPQPHVAGIIIEVFFSTWYPIENYYETKEIHNEWKGFGKKVIMKSYHHSLSTITEALTKNGFYINKLIEPFPTLETQALPRLSSS